MLYPRPKHYRVEGLFAYLMNKRFCYGNSHWKHLAKSLQSSYTSSEHMEILNSASQLHMQFLFRHKDVGLSKAEVASKFINSRFPGCEVVAHHCKIQDKDGEFYRQFHLVVCGLDSIVSRRWINGMLTSLLIYQDGILDQSSVIPLIDGGTEGFKGNVRVVLPGITACIECTLDLYPPQVSPISMFPLRG